MRRALASETLILAATLAVALVPAQTLAAEGDAWVEVTRHSGTERVGISQAAADAIRRSRAAAGQSLERAIQALREAPQEPAVLHELGCVLAAAGRTEQAAETFAELIRDAPDFPGAQANLGKVLVRLRRYDAAIEPLAAVAQREGLGGDVAALLGRCYLETGRPVAAEAAFRRAVVDRPDDRLILLSLAQAQYEQGRYLECERVALSRLAAQPSDRDAWALVVNARIADRRTADAIVAVEALLHVVEQPDPALQWTLGSLYLEHGLPGPAARAYEAAIRSGSPAVDRLDGAIEALLAHGELEQAARFARQALAARSDDAIALLALGRWHLAQGDAASGIQQLEAALVANPLEGRALLALGDAYLDAGRFGDAIARFRAAETLPAVAEDALRAQADAWLARGDFAEALDALYRLLELRPDAAVERLVRAIEERMEVIDKANVPR